MNEKPLKGSIEEWLFATNRDVDAACWFLLPAIDRALAPEVEREGRRALARLLRADDLPLDRVLRQMLAAVFDPDATPAPHLPPFPPAGKRGSEVDGAMALAYGWLAGERIATLSFRSKVRRKSPLKDMFIGHAIWGKIAEARLAGQKISIERATADMADYLDISYDTAKKAWTKYLSVNKGKL
jgi:hypothetical protein